MNGNFIEVELVDGSHIIIPSDGSRVYGIYEDFYYVWSFQKRFPFLKRSKKACTKFWYRNKYETMNDSSDPKLAANCTLMQFFTMFGKQVKPFEVAIVEGDFK